MASYSRNSIAVDAASSRPLAGATIFNNRGAAIGTCASDGSLPYIPSDAYPLTIRMMGYRDAVRITEADSIIALEEIAYELPELLVESKEQRVLHILAYVRDYSTLSTYTDTVTLYREKWVDFMLPSENVRKFNGWRTPRILSTRSYYRFTNLAGLDSVSNRFNQHFSWSDWVGILEQIPLPDRLCRADNVADTVFGRYSPTEIWSRGEGIISLGVDVLADTLGRRWVPHLASFFKDNIDFEDFHVNYRYNDVGSDTVLARDLTDIACSIQSRGRGHSVFRFSRHDEPIFVSTYAEMYIVDQEYITVREARKWEKRIFSSADTDDLPLPDRVPAPTPDIVALISRVDNIDHDNIRLKTEIDPRIGHAPKPLTLKRRLLGMLKSILK